MLIPLETLQLLKERLTGNKTGSWHELAKKVRAELARREKKKVAD